MREFERNKFVGWRKRNTENLRNVKKKLRKIYEDC